MGKIYAGRGLGVNVSTIKASMKVIYIQIRVLLISAADCFHFMHKSQSTKSIISQLPFYLRVSLIAHSIINHDYPPLKLLSEQAVGDVAHLTCRQLTIHASVPVDPNISERRYNSRHIKAHTAKSIDQLFVVSVISKDQRSAYRFTQPTSHWYLLS